MTATFQGIVKSAFIATVKKAESPDEYPKLLAEEIRAGFRANGYEVHKVGACVRIRPSARDEALGRPLAEDEHRQHHPIGGIRGCRACERATMPAEVHGEAPIG